MRKVALLCLLVLLALGSAGAGYALWSETLYINGTVNTGHVDAEWTFVGCFDIESKDVGETSGEIDALDPQILHFTIDNGYPCYTGDCQVEYTYYGSIPAIVESITFLPGQGLTNCSVNQSASTGSFVATCDQLTITFGNGLKTELHEDDFVASSVRVHVEQAADQTTEYEFSVEIELVQWNESIWY